MKFFYYFSSVRRRKVPELSEEQKNEIIDIKRKWTAYKHEQHTNEREQITRAIKSQQNALNQLKLDNFELYKLAIMVKLQNSNSHFN